MTQGFRQYLLPTPDQKGAMDAATGANSTNPFMLLIQFPAIARKEGP